MFLSLWIILSIKKKFSQPSVYFYLFMEYLQLTSDDDVKINNTY